MPFLVNTLWVMLKECSGPLCLNLYLLLPSFPHRTLRPSLSVPLLIESTVKPWLLTLKNKSSSFWEPALSSYFRNFNLVWLFLPTPCPAQLECALCISLGPSRAQCCGLNSVPQMLCSSLNPQGYLWVWQRESLQIVIARFPTWHWVNYKGKKFI
jgi:hypothetical protein